MATLIRHRKRQFVLATLRISAVVAALILLATAIYQEREAPSSYRIEGIAPDLEVAAPTEDEAGLDGFAACNGYVPDLPTEECDGPAVPTNAGSDIPAVPTPPTTTVDAPAVTTPPVDEPEAIDAIEQQIETYGEVLVPFIDTEAEVSETLAAPVVEELADGTAVVSFESVAATVLTEDGTIEANSVTLTGLLVQTPVPGEDDDGAPVQAPVFNIEAAFEVPGTNIVLIPADVSAAAPNGGGVEASVSGFELTIAAIDGDGDGEADEEAGLVLQFDGVEFSGTWAVEAVCLACSGDAPADGEGTGEMVAGGVFLLPDGEVVVLPGLGAETEIAYPAAPPDAVFLATLIDLENDGVFDLSFVAPEGGIEAVEELIEG